MVSKVGIPTQERGNENIPKLRFPEFRDAGEWEERKLAKLVTTITPPKKLISAEYLDEGTYPVIDQSKDYICGWTNDHEALVSGPLPLIVFGDHTCIVKIVNEPFVQGADGIKILSTDNLVNPRFLYQFLLFRPIAMESYKRHFSTLKEKIIFFPKKESGEQQKIANCLSSLDELITAQSRKIDTLKAHEKGLMQQLFPSEDETTPKLRFPEFRDAGEWEVSTMEGVSVISSGGTPSRTANDYWNGDISWITTTLIDFNTISLANEYITEDGIKNSSAKLHPKNTILMAMYGQGKTRGKVAILGIDAAIPIALKN